MMLLPCSPIARILVVMAPKGSSLDLRVARIVVGSLDQLGILVATVDGAGMWTDGNDSFAAWTGRTGEIPTRELLDKEGAARCKRAIRDLFARRSRRARRLVRLRHVEGSERWVEMELSPMADPHGRVTGVLAVGADVTCRVRLQHHLEDGDQTLRQLADALPIAVATLDGGFRFRFVNRCMQRWFGVTDEELVGRQLPAKGKREPFLTIRRAWRQLGDCESSRLEICANHAQCGATLLLTFISRVRDGSGALIGHSVTAIDVTDQRNAERMLELSRVSIHRSNDAVLWIDRRGRIHFANEAACRLLGRSHADVIAMDAKELDSERDEGMWSRLWSEIEATGTVRFDSSHRRLDGTTVPVEVTASYVGEGKQRLAFAFVRDMTDRDREHAERMKLTEQLHHAQRMESLGRLASGVAHDFNNLLTAIAGSVQLALMDVEDTVAVREHLTEAKKAASLASELTAQLLAFGRKQLLRPQVVDVAELLESTRRMARRLIPETVAVDVQAAEGLWWIRVDPARMQQVLINLALNARDAMPVGGQLRLCASNATLAHGVVGFHGPIKAGDYVVMEVKDSGTGIMPHVREHLFEPFFTTKPKGQGSGLGLAIVFGAMAQQGGAIDVLSEPGRGTTIRLYLPRCADPPEEVEASPPSTMPHHPCRILLVEDDKRTRVVTVRMLKRLGHEVVAFASPIEALSAIKRRGKAFELLLTDVVMPEMNGRELALAVRKRLPNLPILFVSGYAEDSTGTVASLEQIGAFLPKPFGLSSLEAAIGRVVGGGG